MEESPSPKNYGTWVNANQNDTMEIPHLSSRLQKWLNCRRLNYSCGPASTLSKILGNSAMTLTPIGGDDFNPCLTPEKSSLKVNFPLHYVESTLKSSMFSGNILERDISESHELEDVASEDYEEIEFSVKKLSLASTSSLESHQSNFATLLAVCGQSVPSSFQDVFSKYWYVPCFLYTCLCMSISFFVIFHDASKQRHVLHMHLIRLSLSRL